MSLRDALELYDTIILIIAASPAMLAIAIIRWVRDDL